MEPIKYPFNANNTPDIDAIDNLLKESGAKLICIENTHNFSGGYVIPVEEMAKLRAVADKYGAKIHMDGARLFHATASLGVNAKEICQYVDSVMVCISKGIGAPVGALMCSTKAKVDEGREFVRFWVADGARRCFAAPGIYAFKHNISRMIEDIENARLTASLLQGKLQHISLQKEVQSNILVLDLAGASVSPQDSAKWQKKRAF
mgnify:CR=1 FL=1